MRDEMRRQSIPEATGVEAGEGIFANGETAKGTMKLRLYLQGRKKN